MDLSNYVEPKPHHIKRILWYFINATIFRCIPSIQLRYIRNAILKLFGANIPWGTLIYSSSKIWAPWNLIVGKSSCIGPNTEIYNKAPIIIKDNCIVSQGAKLYTASHDFTDVRHPLIHFPITLEDKTWVAADAFIGPGVTIHEGAVVGARAVVFKDVEAWHVVAGNPAKFVKLRVMSNAK
uniref:putative colanic acid biosynthesis acetyltransferase n=1 Tax=Acinetobacter soli TaxID=487316 RepID=UPI00125063C4|nr:putative colanic acid biosynthesis acetyltransferase [Acinetobacter soli]